MKTFGKGLAYQLLLPSTTTFTLIVSQILFGQERIKHKCSLPRLNSFIFYPTTTSSTTCRRELIGALTGSVGAIFGSLLPRPILTFASIGPLPVLW